MTAQLWLRKWRVVITDSKDQNALDVSNLRVVFDIKKAREDANWATISIYNLTRETEEQIVLNGDRIIVEAGYHGPLSHSWGIGPNGEYEEDTEEEPQQYGVIFDGKIVFPARHKEGNTDYVLTLVCVDGESQLFKNHVSFTLTRGATQKRIVEAVTAKAENLIPCDCTTSINEVRLPRGKVCFGAPYKFLSDVARGNAGTYWIENGELTMAKWSDEVQDVAKVITPATGLIGMPQQTQHGVSWTMLLDPSAKIFGKYQLKDVFIAEMAQRPNSTAQPLDEEFIYQITELTHKGDTFGNDWYTECNGVSRSGKSALLAVLNNKGSNPNGH